MSAINRNSVCFHPVCTTFELRCRRLQEVFHYFKIIWNCCRGLFKAFHLTWLSSCDGLSVVPAVGNLWFSISIANEYRITSCPHLHSLRRTWNDNFGVTSALKFGFATIDTFLIWWVASSLITHIWITTTILIEVDAAWEETWLSEDLRELVFRLSIRCSAGRQACCYVSLLVSAFYYSRSVSWNRPCLLLLMPATKVLCLWHIWISTKLLLDLALFNGNFIHWCIYCLHVNSIILSANIIVVLIHNLWKVCIGSDLGSLLMWDRFSNALIKWISEFAEIASSSDFVTTFLHLNMIINN